MSGGQGKAARINESRTKGQTVLEEQKENQIIG